MQLINCSTEDFKVASTKTEGIPSHAVEIQGELININKKNLLDWGVKDSAVDGIIAAGIGIPIRMCNSLNPHLCDLKHDSYSDIGYVTKMWKNGDWIVANAAITDTVASQKVKDGTWMPMGKGKWSVSGYPGAEIDNDGMLSEYLPTSISFVRNPAKPAFEGSGYELVVAAVKDNKLQSENIKHNIKEEIMTDEKDDIKTDDPNKTDGQGDIKDVKTEPKEEPKADHKAEPKIESTIKKEEVTMYSQEEFDKKLAESLETQKIEYETHMAEMTSSDDLTSMLSAAKKETIKDTLDQIKREKLVDEYGGLVVASKIISAPFMTDGKLDDSKLKAHIDETKMLSAAVIGTKIEHAKAMVAAMPAGSTAFDKADVPGNMQDADFNAKVSKLGATSIDFSRGA